MAIGCALAFRFSARLGLCSGQDAERAGAAIAASGLPASAGQINGGGFSANRLVRHMAQDKKAEGGRLTFILVKGLGDAFVAKDVAAADVETFLTEEGCLP